MDDAGREFLEQEVDMARGRYVAAFNRIREAQEALMTAKVDAEAMQGALAAYTRTSENPYTPEPLPTLTVLPLSDRKARSLPSRPRNVLTGSAQRPPVVRKGKALDISMDSKAGILRNVIRNFAGEMTIDTLFDGLPTDTPLHITKGDLYRMLPRFVVRGELIKDGRVYHRPGSEAGSKTHFAEV